MLDQITNKTKNKLKIGGMVLIILTVIVSVSLLMSYVEQKKKEEKATQPQSKKKMSLLTEKVEKDLWVAAEGQNIKSLEKSNEELRGKLDVLMREIEEVKKQKYLAPEKEKTPPPPAVVVTPTPKQMPKGQPPLPSSVDREGLATKGGEKTETTTPISPEKVTAPTAPSKEIKIFEDSGKKTSSKGGDDKDKESGIMSSLFSKKRTDKVWLSSGSFMRARLINGIDAPTSGGAQSEPYPVLMVVKDMSILPNNFRMSLVECFIIGAGYGNISDERAYIKTERLSCIRKDGQAIDISLKGHVVGEDGKLGMRGKVVSKQGQQIAMAIFSGTLAGLGNALKPQQAMSLNLNPTGSSGINTPDIGDVLTGGVTGGVGNALNKVADHYLKMAEKMFPIIEIDAGRDVEILILIGQELSIKTVSAKDKDNTSRKTGQQKKIETRKVSDPTAKTSRPIETNTNNQEQRRGATFE